MCDVLVCLVLHQFVNGLTLLFKLLALQPYIDVYSRLHVEHLEVLELSHWDALKAVYEVLGLAQETLERLEDEHTPKKFRALKYLWEFVCIMAQRSTSDSVVVLSSQQCITIPLAWEMGDKMLAELDDPNWVFPMAFMPYIDPIGEYFVIGTWSM